jgi:cation transport ATPase
MACSVPDARAGWKSALRLSTASSPPASTSSPRPRWSAGTRRCDPQAIGRRVGEAGYRLIERQSLADTAARFDREVQRLALRLAVAIVFGMWSMGAALILYVQPDIASPVAWWIALASGLFALPVLAYSGAAIFRMAWRSIRLRAPGLDLLIATGASGAVVLSTASLVRGEAQVYFDTATMLVTLLLLGRLIETRVRRTAIKPCRRWTIWQRTRRSHWRMVDRWSCGSLRSAHRS